MTESSMQPASDALVVSDLKFRYPGEAADAPWVIDVPRLVIERGGQMLLTGGSGCGKSTLLHLIAGLIEPDQGTVEVAGRNVHAMSARHRDAFRGRAIGMIFQTFNLLPGFTALENVMAALLFSDTPPAEHESIAKGWLEKLGLTDVHRMPEKLSVGQQQRVAVARAMVVEPVLVLADEPTASLDPETGRSAITLIQAACRDAGAALLCVSHDPSMVERFERHAGMTQLASEAAV